MRLGLVIGVMLCSVASLSVSAQWLTQPTPGLPRTAEGQPDLQAPAPRTADGKPDLSGIWGWKPGRYSGDILRDLQSDDIQPWARALSDQRMEDLGKDDPANILCLPQGPRVNLFPPLLAKIVRRRSSLFSLKT